MRADRRFGTAPPSVRWVDDSYDRWADRCRAAGYDPIEEAIAYGNLTVAEYLQSSQLSPTGDEPSEIF